MRDTIEMAREAWISETEAEMLRYSEECYLSCTYLSDLKAFEALVRADEREACAKVCEDMPAGMFSCDMNGRTVDGYVAQWKVAEDIRARGQA